MNVIGNNPVSREVDNNPQSQTFPLFQYFLMTQVKKDITVPSAIPKDAVTFPVNTGHGIAIGNTIVIREGDVFEQTLVTNVVGDDITVEMPLPVEFSTECNIMNGSKNFAVNGSVTPVDFTYDPTMGGNQSPVVPIDLNYLVITMRHSSEGDDSKFGGIAALTNGIYLRKLNGTIVNLGNYKINQDFVDRGWVYIQREKSGGGEFSTTLTLNIKEVFTQESRFNPRIPETAIMTQREDLTGLISMTFSLLGSFTSGE